MQKKKKTNYRCSSIVVSHYWMIGYHDNSCSPLPVRPTPASAPTFWASAASKHLIFTDVPWKSGRNQGIAPRKWRTDLIWGFTNALFLWMPKTCYRSFQQRIRFGRFKAACSSSFGRKSAFSSGVAGGKRQYLIFTWDNGWVLYVLIIYIYLYIYIRMIRLD